MKIPSLSEMYDAVKDYFERIREGKTYSDDWMRGHFEGSGKTEEQIRKEAEKKEARKKKKAAKKGKIVSRYVEEITPEVRRERKLFKWVYLGLVLTLVSFGGCYQVNGKIKEFRAREGGDMPQYLAYRQELADLMFILEKDKRKNESFLEKIAGSFSFGSPAPVTSNLDGELSPAQKATSIKTPVYTKVRTGTPVQQIADVRKDITDIENTSKEIKDYLIMELYQKIFRYCSLGIPVLSAIYGCLVTRKG